MGEREHGPTTPPRDALLPERHERAPAPGESIPSHYARCFGCGPEHPTGLHIALVAGEGLAVVGDFVPAEHHQGAPGLAHGGILSSACDEVLGALNWLLLVPSVTGRLEVDFRRPVQVGSPVRIEAQIVGQSGRKVYARGSGSIDAGPPAFTATALFVQVDIEHFRAHARPQDLEAARASGLVRGSLERLDLNP